MSQSLEARKKKLELTRQVKLMHDELPHLYGWPWYVWAWEFFKTRKKMALLCAANQISKSSTQIRTAIDWATDTSDWHNKWPELGARKPNLFWYMYPSKEVATREFKLKWIPEFLPRGSMKRHPIYGWKAVYDKKQIDYLEFNSGVTIDFKTYSQDVLRLQASSVYAVFGDEEMPKDKYDEAIFRLGATKGYFRMVFTATLGQEFWWEAIEAMGTSRERFPQAWKRQISMYDCLKYRDGSASTWTIDKIKEIEALCSSKSEILRRVYGRFIKDKGRKFHAFDPTLHYTDDLRKVPKGWAVYSGVDIGSGGEKGHPSAIVFVAVSPNHQRGYVVAGWRGDGIETTSGDVLEKYREMCAEYGFRPVQQVYDYAAKDFGTIATRQGLSFMKANKDHKQGTDIANTLFKHDLLKLYDNEELRKLGGELLKLNVDTPKNKAKDDFCDALRYCVVSIPWDFNNIRDDVEEEKVVKPFKPLSEKELIAQQIAERRGMFADPSDNKEVVAWDHNSEISFWNDLYGN